MKCEGTKCVMYTHYIMYAPFSAVKENKCSLFWVKMQLFGLQSSGRLPDLLLKSAPTVITVDTIANPSRHFIFSLSVSSSMLRSLV